MAPWEVKKVGTAAAGLGGMMVLLLVLEKLPKLATGQPGAMSAVVLGALLLVAALMLAGGLGLLARRTWGQRLLSGVSVALVAFAVWAATRTAPVVPLGLAMASIFVLCCLWTPATREWLDGA